MVGDYSGLRQTRFSFINRLIMRAAALPYCVRLKFGLKWPRRAEVFVNAASHGERECPSAR